MSGSTALVSSTPDFVTNATGYGGQDVRLGTGINEVPGLLASGDFAVSQRGAGANMSVDIAQGRALLDPQQATHQGIYAVRRTSGTAYNTSADGAFTWTAADPTNGRIDLLCIEIKDTDMDASGTTGWRFRVVDGTPNAAVNTAANLTQYDPTYWPAIPTGVLPIAAIRVPAAATTLTTANIANLNPIGGSRPAAQATATLETTTSGTLIPLATPDFAFGYVPANSKVQIGHHSQWKTATAATAGVALFINGTQLKAPINTGAPVTSDFEVALGAANFYSHLATFNPTAATTAATSGGFLSVVGATADVSDVSTGEIFGIGAAATTYQAASPITVFGLAAGWYLFALRFKTNASTLSVQNRKTWMTIDAAG